MDPNCAICDGPPKNRCDCEFRTLVHAVEESEQRVLEPMYDEIRYLVLPLYHSSSRLALIA